MPLQEDVKRRMKQWYPTTKPLFSRKDSLHPNNVYKDVKKGLNVANNFPVFWILVVLGGLMFLKVLFNQ